jgi:hypothetical protein
MSCNVLLQDCTRHICACGIAFVGGRLLGLGVMSGWLLIAESVLFWYVVALLLSGSVDGGRIEKMSHF